MELPIFFRGQRNAVLGHDQPRIRSARKSRSSVRTSPSAAPGPSDCEFRDRFRPRHGRHFQPTVLVPQTTVAPSRPAWATRNAIIVDLPLPTMPQMNVLPTSRRWKWIDRAAPRHRPEQRRRFAPVALLLPCRIGVQRRHAPRSSAKRCSLAAGTGWRSRAPWRRRPPRGRSVSRETTIPPSARLPQAAVGHVLQRVLVVGEGQQGEGVFAEGVFG